MPDGSIECILGEMQAQLRNLEKLNESQSKQLCELSSRVRKVEDTILSARTGWATIIWIGSLLTSIGVGGAWVYNHFYDHIMKLLRAGGFQ